MSKIKALLYELSFDFNTELEEKVIFVKDDGKLNKRLKGKLFIYQANERQKLNDFFIKEPNSKLTNKQIDCYNRKLIRCLEMYFKANIFVDDAEFDSLQLIKLNIRNVTQATAKKVGLYLLNEIFNDKPSTSVLLGKEINFSKEAIYLARKHISKNWRDNKAFEDSRYILDHLIPMTYE